MQGRQIIPVGDGITSGINTPFFESTNLGRNFIVHEFADKIEGDAIVVFKFACGQIFKLLRERLQCLSALLNRAEAVISYAVVETSNAEFGGPHWRILHSVHPMFGQKRTKLVIVDANC